MEPMRDSAAHQMLAVSHCVPLWSLEEKGSPVPQAQHDCLSKNTLNIMVGYS